MATLYIYIAASCPGCTTARIHAAEMQKLRPQYRVECIDLSLPGMVQPPYIFGTPTYCLDERVIALGNPSLPALLRIIDTTIHSHEGTGG